MPYQPKLPLPIGDPLSLIARTAFPDYAGRKIQLLVHTESGMDLRSGWSGGSRDYFKVVAIDGRTLTIGQNGTMFERESYDNAPLPAPGALVIEHTIFCGKDLGLTVHVHSADYIPTALPPVTLTDAERKVLVITKGIIASYRKGEAERVGISTAQWNATKDALIARGLLRKNGAISDDGKIAIAGEPMRI